MKPGLYGIKKTNRDLTKEDNWGKNKFNNNFPIALVNYMDSENIEPKYIKLSKELKTEHSFINAENLYKISPKEVDNIYYSFETQYSPYQRFSIDEVPGADVTIIKLGNKSELDKVVSSLEIKLTALPDNSTFMLTEDKYSCELVIRPGTIVYLAFSIIDNWIEKEDELKNIFDSNPINIDDWNDGNVVLENMKTILKTLNEIMLVNIDKQKPLILEPIWKTVEKSPKLAEQCLDVFVWSDLGFSRLFMDASATSSTKINRYHRSSVWLYLMLKDYAEDKKVDHKYIIDTFTYNVKNDKAFALTGNRTYSYLKCAELTTPRVSINEIQKIILNGGEKFLSPERRFDAAVVAAPGLFKNLNE